MLRPLLHTALQSTLHDYLDPLPHVRVVRYGLGPVTTSDVGVAEAAAKEYARFYGLGTCCAVLCCTVLCCRC